MIIKSTKIIRFFCSILIIFFLSNIFIISPVFATGNTTNGWNTILKGIVRFSEVLVVGFFTIRFTIVGIQYFITVSTSTPSEKADNRNKLRWTLIYAVIAIVGIRMFLYFVGA